MSRDRYHVASHLIHNLENEASAGLQVRHGSFHSVIYLGGV